MAETDSATRRILLIICGGIAAYKSLELIRRLRDHGCAVRAVMTAAAEHFVTPLSVAALCGQAVRTDLFSLTDEAEMGHIELSRWADLIVVAPATADFLAKMAQGRADDLASTLVLASDKSVLAAPAMNHRMWLHPATQRNIATLKADGVGFVGPDEGAMACGEFGPGRMAAPEAILAAILPAQPLKGRHVLVTAGPTHEPIDPVRFIGNRSSGLQGYAIARAAAQAGARVTLVSGPVALPAPAGVARVSVETAVEMLAAVEAALPADVFIGAAAVADWRVERVGENKIKKSDDAPPALTLVENPDILRNISKSKTARPKLVVGFAAETENVLDHARLKLARKGCDFIVANAVGGAEGAFGAPDNAIHIVTHDNVISWPRMGKDRVAVGLIQIIVEELGRLQ